MCGAVVAGFAVFIAAKRSIFTSVVRGEIVMLSGKGWRG
jgi:hypothetical protein